LSALASTLGFEIVDIAGFLSGIDRHTRDETENLRSLRAGADRMLDGKAGSNTAPFLLQVYRRDMGGGQFAVMKDLSAPIVVKGSHWGGLRMGYQQ